MFVAARGHFMGRININLTDGPSGGMRVGRCCCCCQCDDCGVNAGGYSNNLPALQTTALASLAVVTSCVVIVSHCKRCFPHLCRRTCSVVEARCTITG